MLKILFFLPIIFFTACEIETEESNRYQVSQDLDKGNFQAVLDNLDCDNPNGFTAEECHINRGMAYFGLAGYDITSIGEDMFKAYSDKNINETAKTIKITSILLDRFKNPYISQGINEYKFALKTSNKDKGDCIADRFSELSDNEQQSCISINPILLLNVLDNSGDKTNASVDLQDLIDVEKSIRGIAPNISSEEIANMLNNNFDKTSSETQNQIDATQCLIDNSLCKKLGFKNPLKIGEYQDFQIWRLSKLNFKTLKLTNNFGSIVLVEENRYITPKNESCSETEYHKYSNQCFPKPSENNETLTSVLVDKLNKDEFKTSIALMLNVGDTKDSEQKQVDDFMTELCGNANCEVTESNLMNYLAEDN